MRILKNDLFKMFIFEIFSTKLLFKTFYSIMEIKMLLNTNINFILYLNEYCVDNMFNRYNIKQKKYTYHNNVN